MQWRVSKIASYFVLLLALNACDCGGEGLHSVRPIIEATPNPLVFDSVIRGVRAERTLTIRNAGDAELRVTAINVAAGADAGYSVAALTEDLRIMPSQTREVVVALLAASADSSTGELSILSNDPDRPDHRVQLTAMHRQ